jgi:glycosyltransferase involved in cell wall biosynthesis
MGTRKIENRDGESAGRKVLEGSHVTLHSAVYPNDRRRPLNLGFAATNPCHVYSLAQAVAELDSVVTCYMGYPRWRLHRPYPTNLRTHSFRTIVTYGLLRLPTWLRPEPKALFQWQDKHFDHWVGQSMEEHDFIHAMPGQALQIFRRARKEGISTVLNHATGPARHVVKVMKPEYQRAGLKLEESTCYNESYWAQADEEYDLADWHCVASTLVRDQLIEQGINGERIWIVPYGAEPRIFYPPISKTWERFRILFAGQVTLRKGIASLLQALSSCRSSDWIVDFYGVVSADVKKDLAAYRGQVPLRFHGAVPQSKLAEVMRGASVLVLPSLEEGFGLVVPQSLACGTPCVVSDQVGAKDLVEAGVNGSIFPANDPLSLLEQLHYWAEQKRCVMGDFSWREPAQQLLAHSTAALTAQDDHL